MMIEVYQDLVPVLMTVGLIMTVTSARLGFLFVRSGNGVGTARMRRTWLRPWQLNLVMTEADTAAAHWPIRLVTMIQRKLAPDDDDDEHDNSLVMNERQPLKRECIQHDYLASSIHPSCT